MVVYTYFRGTLYCPLQIAELKEWAKDCVWQDYEPEEIDEISDIQILRNCHVALGGLENFDFENPFFVAETKPLFKIGDTAIYINDNGVNWGAKKITGLRYWRRSDGEGHWRYHYENSDTPWFPVNEKNLTKVN